MSHDIIWQYGVLRLRAPSKLTLAKSIWEITPVTLTQPSFKRRKSLSPSSHMSVPYEKIKASRDASASHYPDSNGKVRIRRKLASETVQPEGRKDRKNEGKRCRPRRPAAGFSLSGKTRTDAQLTPRLVRQRMPTLGTKSGARPLKTSKRPASGSGPHSPSGEGAVPKRWRCPRGATCPLSPLQAAFVRRPGAPPGPRRTYRGCAGRHDGRQLLALRLFPLPLLRGGRGHRRRRSGREIPSRLTHVWPGV